MGLMKQLHHEICCRVKQLQRGAPLKAKCAQYVQNDASIELAKHRLQEWLRDTHEPGLNNPPAGVPIEEH